MKRGKDWLIGYLMGAVQAVTWSASTDPGLKKKLEDVLAEAKKELENE